MIEIYMSKAIKKLRPTAEFSFVDADYSTIKWDVLEGDAPSLAEIEKTIDSIKKEEAEAEAVAASKKAAAESKLLALGLTIEDIKALGLG